MLYLFHNYYYYRHLYHTTNYFELGNQEQIDCLNKLKTDLSVFFRDKTKQSDIISLIKNKTVVLDKYSKVDRARLKELFEETQTKKKPIKQIQTADHYITDTSVLCDLNSNSIRVEQIKKVKIGTLAPELQSQLTMNHVRDEDEVGYFTKDGVMGSNLAPSPLLNHIEKHGTVAYVCPRVNVNLSTTLDMFLNGMLDMSKVIASEQLDDVLADRGNVLTEDRLSEIDFLFASKQKENVHIGVDILYQSNWAHHVCDIANLFNKYQRTRVNTVNCKVLERYVKSKVYGVDSSRLYFLTQLVKTFPQVQEKHKQEIISLLEDQIMLPIKIEDISFPT